MKMRMMGMVLGMWGIAGTMGCNAILNWKMPGEVLAPSCSETNLTCGVEGEFCCASRFVEGCNASNGCGTAVPSIFLDAYEVTVGRVKVYVANGGEYAAEEACTGVDDCATAPNCPKATYKAQKSEDSDNLPMNCLTFAEAEAFCRWDEGRLPTLAELKWVTKNIDPQEILKANAVIQQSSIGPAIVGTKDFMPTGYADLIGNLAEWTGDPKPTGFGGSFQASEADFSAGIIPSLAPSIDTRAANIGFRCVREP